MAIGLYLHWWCSKRLNSKQRSTPNRTPSKRMELIKNTLHLQPHSGEQTEEEMERMEKANVLMHKALEMTHSSSIKLDDDLKVLCDYISLETHGWQDIVYKLDLQESVDTDQPVQPFQIQNFLYPALNTLHQTGPERKVLNIRVLELDGEINCMIEFNARVEQFNSTSSNTEVPKYSVKTSCSNPTILNLRNENGEPSGTRIVFPLIKG